MKSLLRIATGIDAVTRSVARVAQWALLANALLVAGNAVGRKFFAISTPVIYDLQWHFFAAVVLFMAAYTLQRNEHVRVDILAQRLGERGLAKLDLFGIVLVLLPVCLLMAWATTPTFVAALVSGETRGTREVLSNIPAWIIKSFLPTGFFLLAVQGVAEAIRCVACLKGAFSRPVLKRQLIDGSA